MRHRQWLDPADMTIPSPVEVPKSSMHVVLIGMMGSGKSTTGKMLASLLKRRFVDTDVLIEHVVGQTVAEIFESDGEAAFRTAERRVLLGAISSAEPGVIALGGGAVLDQENQVAISRAGTVVWLRARPETLAKRVGDGSNRPLLGGGTQPSAAQLGDVAGDLGGVVSTLEELCSKRMPLYQSLADVVVDVDEMGPRDVATSVADAIIERVRVELGERSYDVVVGPGAARLLSGLLPVTAKRAMVVTGENIGFEVTTHLPTETVFVPSGEKNKSLANVEKLCSAFARFGLTRNDVVIAVGGGMVTDLAGFAAASYHRGTAVVHVATSLLAQVDAAIGGKTGVNIAEGKNLVGAFWQPHAVVCDTDALATLPPREWRSGLGEMAKYAFIGAGDLSRMSLLAQITTCVRLKAKVVSTDEREGGRRMILNYGHTLAHALEAAGFADRDDYQGSGVDLRHGEAVGIGLVFAARLAHRLGRISADRVQSHIDLVSGYGLPTCLPVGPSPDDLIEWMSRDKKATDGLTFVLDGPAGVEVLHDLDQSLVRSLIDAEMKRSRDDGSVGSTGGHRL